LQFPWLIENRLADRVNEIKVTSVNPIDEYGIEKIVQTGPDFGEGKVGTCPGDFAN